MGRPLSVSKSLAEFAARRRQSSPIIFRRDMCVGKNTAQAAGAKIMRAAGCNSFRRLFSQQLRDLHGVGGCALAHLVAAAPNVQAVVRG